MSGGVSLEKVNQGLPPNPGRFPFFWKVPDSVPDPFRNFHVGEVEKEEQPEEGRIRKIPNSYDISKPDMKDKSGRANPSGEAFHHVKSRHQLIIRLRFLRTTLWKGSRIFVRTMMRLECVDGNKDKIRHSAPRCDSGLSGNIITIYKSPESLGKQLAQEP